MHDVAIANPIAGRLLPLDAVPDPVFAERMLGDGVAIDPVDGQVTAPCDAVVISVHDAGHAITLDCGGGVTVLIHVGLDTVGLGGRGFTPLVRAGDAVRAGEPVLRVDLDAVAREARSLVTPIVVTRGAVVGRAAAGGILAGGVPLMTVRGAAPADAVEGPSPASDTQATEAVATASRRLRLVLANGVHARPAARVAAAAARFDATVSLVADDGRTASAASPVEMLALALKHGASVEVRAHGPQAEAAVDAVEALLASGMGELLPLDAAPPVRATRLPVTLASPGAPGDDGLRGVAAAPGLAIGPACRRAVQEVVIPHDGAGADREAAALDDARGALRHALAAEVDGEGAAAAIAAAHLALLDDPSIDAATRRAIGDGRSAARAWHDAIEGFRGALLHSGERHFAERADDLADLQRRMVALLLDVPGAPPPPAGAILIADDLFPSDLAMIAQARVAGVATVRGGATSHAAIIAAGLGLPMVAAVGTALHDVAAGATLIVDGDGGRVKVVSDGEAAGVRAAIADRHARRAAAVRHAHEPAATRDGVRIEVAANIGAVGDAVAAAGEGADGCGLLRTELLFLDRATPPDLEEQRALYQSVADALGDRPVIVRTLDIGADKPAAYIDQPEEENPALGLRGIRLQRAVAGLLDTQLRALLSVTGPARLHVMLPMVTQVAEIVETRALLARLADAMGRAPPPLGIMVETPAAALIADRLAAHADFLSIGTNDLTQYTLAADRTNAAVAPLVDALDPAVLQLVGMAARGGAAHGRWTGVCGGMAADPMAIPLLIGLGVTELSVPPARVAETKALVRTLDAAQCRNLAQGALAASDARVVRALVEDRV